MCGFTYAAISLGGHKQWVSRLLAPWQYINVIVTATEWKNFFDLRIHPDAQPEMHDLAVAIKQAQDLCRESGLLDVKTGSQGWHLPYVTAQERDTFEIKDLLKMSSARCARVSYLTHDGKAPDITKDVELHDKLVGSKPEHASPTEHQAWFVPYSEAFYYNLQGWKSYRWMRDHDVL